MKKYLLIGLLFIWASLPYICLNASTADLISVSRKAFNKNDAQTQASNDFRRQLLSHLSTHYREQLGDYFAFWQASGQNFDRNLINDLTPETQVLEQRKQRVEYTATMRLRRNDFTNRLRPSNPRVSELARKYRNNKNIDDIVMAIDISLSQPTTQTKLLLDTLLEHLKSISIEYPAKHLIYRDTTVDIPFRTNNLPSTAITFTHSGKRVVKEGENTINLRVAFDNSTADFKLPANTENSVIVYDFDIEKTFKTTNLTRKVFIDNLITSHLVNKAGTIEIQKIMSSIFYVASENFPTGITATTELLRRKDWQVGNASNHTHIAMLSKITVEERRLNIGGFYAKAYLELVIYDKQGNRQQAFRSNDVEALDNASVTNCHIKIDRMLLEEIDRLF